MHNIIAAVRAELVKVVRMAVKIEAWVLMVEMVVLAIVRVRAAIVVHMAVAREAVVMAVLVREVVVIVVSTAQAAFARGAARSEERRVGKEC